MNLKQLEVLKAVMATGSTVGASAILQLSQSAISRHLTALEADIGFELFIRDKGRLIPRPEARALVPEVEELTDVLERVKRKATDLKSGLGSDTLLRVAFPHSMTTTVLPAVLSAFSPKGRASSSKSWPALTGRSSRWCRQDAPTSASCGCPPRTRGSTSARSCAATSRA